MSKIIDKFKRLQQKQGISAVQQINSFLEKEKDNYYKEKIISYKNQGFSVQEATTKARQSWVTHVGSFLEKIIVLLIQQFCEENKLSITSDKNLRSSKLPEELDEVRRAIVVHFDNHSLLPDGDIIIYRWQKNKPEILAILSVKNSFRERYTETPYWKLKLLQSKITQHIKVFMVTPDKDREISSGINPRKARIVMEYELDGIYLARDNFDESEKIKSISELIPDLEKLL